MADEPRVFDSVTAAVANSAQPAPPPYAPEPADGPLPASDPEPVPVVARVSKRRTPARTAGPTAPVEPKGGHVSAGAGVAEAQGKAEQPK